MSNNKPTGKSRRYSLDDPVSSPSEQKAMKNLLRNFMSSSSPITEDADTQVITPIAGEMPTAGNTPTVDKKSLVDVLPTVDNLPTQVKMPTVGNTPAIDKKPTVDTIPTIDNLPTQVKMPTVDKSPTVIDNQHSADYRESATGRQSALPTVDIAPTVGKTPTTSKIKTIGKPPTVGIQPITAILDAAYVEPVSEYFKTPNEVPDLILHSLDGSEFKLFYRLFRLSHGFRRYWCLAGYGALSKGTGLDVRTIQRLLPKLERQQYVKILGSYNSADLKGTLYLVYPFPNQDTLGRLSTVGIETSVGGLSSNKHDHDDYKIHDHHQNDVMKIYISLTGNTWNPVVDDPAYEQIKHLPIDQIEQLMRVIHRDAANPIGSFAFFAKSIKQRLAQGRKGTQSHGQIKKRMAEIVSIVRELHVGDAGYTTADFVEDIKQECISRGVTYDNDVFNELMAARG